MALDKKICRKFQTVWISVRRAFLELDDNRDGIIEAEDIARYFGDEDAVDIVDLRKLLWEKKRLYDTFMRDAERAGHMLN